MNYHNYGKYPYQNMLNNKFGIPNFLQYPHLGFNDNPMSQFTQIEWWINFYFQNLIINNWHRKIFFEVWPNKIIIFYIWKLAYPVSNMTKSDTRRELKNSEKNSTVKAKRILRIRFVNFKEWLSVKKNRNKFFITGSF